VASLNLLQSFHSEGLIAAVYYLKSNQFTTICKLLLSADVVNL